MEEQDVHNQAEALAKDFMRAIPNDTNPAVVIGSCFYLLAQMVSMSKPEAAAKVQAALVHDAATIAALVPQLIAARATDGQVEMLLPAGTMVH